MIRDDITMRQVPINIANVHLAVSCSPARTLAWLDNSNRTYERAAPYREFYAKLCVRTLNSSWRVHTTRGRRRLLCCSRANDAPSIIAESECNAHCAANFDSRIVNSRDTNQRQRDETRRSAMSAYMCVFEDLISERQ